MLHCEIIMVRECQAAKKLYCQNTSCNMSRSLHISISEIHYNREVTMSGNTGIKSIHMVKSKYMFPNIWVIAVIILDFKSASMWLQDNQLVFLRSPMLFQ